MKMSEHFLDYTGVAEFYADCLGEVEDMGNGLIRVVYCTDHHGVMVPTVSVVRPATSVLQLSRVLRDLAEKILCRECGGSCRN